MRFHLTIMRPATDAGRFYTQGFHELVETIAYALVALGHEVSYKSNGFVPEAQNLVFGAQFAESATQFPAGTILYNLEQIGGSPMHLIAEELAKRYVIWDYSPTNLAYWHLVGIKAHYVPIGYMPQLTRIPPKVQDIDVLFYGSLNPRRAKIIEQLQKMPALKVVITQRFGAERDELISRAKLVLNLHYYERPQLFEIVRCSYLLANRKCVVSESSDDFPMGLLGGLRQADYDDLVDACRSLLSDVEQRLEFQRRGFELFSRMRETEILRNALRSTTPCTENSAVSRAS